MSKSKNTLLKYQSITNGDMSASSLTSSVTNIQQLDEIGYQFNWSGSPTGTIAIQVSIDYAQDLNGNVTVSGHWTPLTLTYWDTNTNAFVTAQSIPTSVGSPVYLDLTLLSAPWIRAVYTKGSGTGTLQAYITAKEV